MSKNKTTTLIIMDGWGIASVKNKGNAISSKTAPNYFGWLKKFPNTQLEASGESVGLFKNEEGNSEAGHLNLGAGRVVQQDAVYISAAIVDGTFFKNNAFLQALHHIKKYDTATHLIGLLSNHNSAHSCPEHLYALLDFFYRHQVKKVFLHLFTDGRDSGQHDAPNHLKKLEEKLHESQKIATVMGRFYAMDRNKAWERTRAAYEAMVAGKGLRAESAGDALVQAYNRGETDEFISPSIVVKNGKPIAKIGDNDGVFFFNLRSDRARQLTKTFVQADFDSNGFRRVKVPKNIRFVALTDFGPDLPGVLTAYPSRDVVNSLTQTLCPRPQMYIAESEKYAHVTYFFNGGYAHHWCDERRVKIDSPKVKYFSEKPEMNAKTVADFVMRAIVSGEYDFICVNFANPDMIGHTGDLKAGEKAVKCVDEQVQRVIDVILENNGQAVITADHGNIEEMVNIKTNEINTEHSINPVPMILIGKKFSKVKLKKGKLGDVAPTILKMMNLPKPKEMTGKA
ncbi:MAG: 2,3-bisphosphoglycerate-independent phosphoglycerate mutase, partial [bacterium]